MTPQREDLAATDVTFSDDQVGEMLALAARLRQATGGELDDAAIQAVAEATGAPTDYVRIALRSVVTAGIARPGYQLRSVLLSVDPTVRRAAVGACLASGLGLAMVLGQAFGDAHSLYGIAEIVLGLGALYNISLCRDAKSSAIAGAMTGAMIFVAAAVFHAILALFVRVPPMSSAVLLIPYALGGTIAGLLVSWLTRRGALRMGGKDPAVERQELLRQLVELQDKLRQGEQSLTFLSVDIVGSTRMKEGADPLAVEYTFSEFHRFVEAIVRQHSGHIHSTAGDGAIAAFEEPAQALAAGKRIQAALFELNARGNKLASPISLRIGIHTGNVVPPGPNVQSVSFAHVIDIANHLQRVCPVGCVAISEFSAAHVPGGADAIGSERVSAHDVHAIVWRPRSAIRIPGEQEGTRSH